MALVEYSGKNRRDQRGETVYKARFVWVLALHVCTVYATVAVVGVWCVPSVRARLAAHLRCKRAERPLRAAAGALPSHQVSSSITIFPN